jgi:hypothetical protein
VHVAAHRAPVDLARAQVDEPVRLRGHYLAYLLTILGVWKVAGTVAILAPGFPRLKEWAYAGIFFDLTGAAASHAASGDVVWHIVAPSILAVLTVASWALRPPSRVLGTLRGKEHQA